MLLPADRRVQLSTDCPAVLGLALRGASASTPCLFASLLYTPSDLTRRASGLLGVRPFTRGLCRGFMPLPPCQKCGKRSLQRRHRIYLTETGKGAYYCWLCAAKAIQDGSAYTKHVVAVKRLGITEEEARRLQAAQRSQKPSS